MKVMGSQIIAIYIVFLIVWCCYIGFETEKKTLVNWLIILLVGLLVVISPTITVIGLVNYNAMPEEFLAGFLMSCLITILEAILLICAVRQKSIVIDDKDSSKSEALILQNITQEKISGKLLEDIQQRAIPQEEAINRKVKEEENNILKIAKSDYKKLKAQLIEYASSEGYTTLGSDKTITYYFAPDSNISKWVYNYGYKLGKSMAINLGLIEYSPANPEQWSLYISEITTLGKGDNISITPVLLSNKSSDLEINFPILTQDKQLDLGLSVSLKLKCFIIF